MLRFGDKSIEVKELQEWLRDIGLYEGNESYYGVATTEAVRKLQNLLGLTTTGVFDNQIRYIFELGGYNQLSPSTLDKDTYIVGGPVAGFDPNNPFALTGGSYTGKGSSGSSGGATNNSGSYNSSNQAGFNDSHLLSKQAIPCYLVNLATNNDANVGVVFFPHIPEEFTYSKGNIFEEQSTIGRSEPYQGYSGSTALTTTVVLQLSADYAPNKDLDSVLRALETFAYPRYGVSVRPPKCFFRCATFTLEGILTEISITRQLPIINGKYSKAEVSISLTETNERSVSASTVRDKPYRAFR